MKPILFPTDFTTPVQQSLGYVLSVCQTMQAPLLLLHACPPPYDFASREAEASTSLVEEAQQALDKLIERLRAQGHLEKEAVEHMVFSGELPEAIAQAISQHQPSLVAMPSQGAHGLDRLLKGSRTTDVLRALEQTPLLVLPQGKSPDTLRGMVFATEYRSGDLAALAQLEPWRKAFGGSMHSVHVAKTYSHHDKLMLRGFKAMVQEAMGWNLDHHHLMGEDLLAVLESFTANLPDKLLVMARYPQSLADQLLGRSQTQAMAFEANTPLLILHAEEQE